MSCDDKNHRTNIKAIYDQFCPTCSYKQEEGNKIISELQKFGFSHNNYSYQDVFIYDLFNDLNKIFELKELIDNISRKIKLKVFE